MRDLQHVNDLRKASLLKRSGIDPLRLQKGSISDFMNDEIPEKRWIRELNLIKRTDFKDLQNFLIKKFHKNV